MKTKHGIIFLSLGIFIFSSCITVKYYGTDTTAFETKYFGNIIEFKKSAVADSNDIILNGKEDFRLGFDPLYPNEVDLMKWTGKIWFNDISYDIQINYRQKKGNYGIENIRELDIQNLPPIYRFEKFNISGSQAIWEKSVHESELPVKLATFSIEDAEFYVLLTSMHTVATMKDSMSSFIQMVKSKDQVFHIVSSDGIIYAEFTNDKYKIFKVNNSKLVPEKLWPCIAVFSIVRIICSK